MFVYKSITNPSTINRRNPRQTHHPFPNNTCQYNNNTQQPRPLLPLQWLTYRRFLIRFLRRLNNDPHGTWSMTRRGLILTVDHPPCHPPPLLPLIRSYEGRSRNELEVETRGAYPRRMFASRDIRRLHRSAPFFYVRWTRRPGRGERWSKGKEEWNNSEVNFYYVR